jgi:predicted alpha/beta hydrolase family esterase
VVWGNASCHKAAHVQRRLEEHNAAAAEAGAPKTSAFDLPTCSPWLSPVETAINQTKRLVLLGRNIGEPAARRRALDTHFAQRSARLAAAHK